MEFRIKSDKKPIIMEKLRQEIAIADGIKSIERRQQVSPFCEIRKKSTGHVAGDRPVPSSVRVRSGPGCDAAWIQETAARVGRARCTGGSGGLAVRSGGLTAAGPARAAWAGR